MGTGSLPSVLWPLLTSAPARCPLLDAAPDPAAGLGEQISLSRDANSACASAPFSSGGEHRVLRCGASLPAPSAWNGISVRRLTGLTAASFPRNLAIPQLPYSIACAILLPMQASLMTVFLRAGTSTPPVRAHVRRTQQGGANGRQSSGSNTNSTSGAAASRRSP